MKQDKARVVKATKKELRKEAKEAALLAYDIFKELKLKSVKIDSGQNYAKERKE